MRWLTAPHNRPARFTVRKVDLSAKRGLARVSSHPACRGIEPRDRASAPDRGGRQSKTEGAGDTRNHNACRAVPQARLVRALLCGAAGRQTLPSTKLKITLGQVASYSRDEQSSEGAAGTTVGRAGGVLRPNAETKTLQAASLCLGRHGATALCTIRERESSSEDAARLRRTRHRESAARASREPGPPKRLVDCLFKAGLRQPTEETSTERAAQGLDPQPRARPPGDRGKQKGDDKGRGAAGARPED